MKRPVSLYVHSLITKWTISKRYNISYEDSLMMTRVVCSKHVGELITCE
jgi:hypothetical protein